jgi:hypothetical protein
MDVPRSLQTGERPLSWLHSVCGLTLTKPLKGHLRALIIHAESQRSLSTHALCYVTKKAPHESSSECLTSPRSLCAVGCFRFKRQHQAGGFMLWPFRSANRTTRAKLQMVNAFNLESIYSRPGHETVRLNRLACVIAACGLQ